VPEAAVTGAATCIAASKIYSITSSARASSVGGTSMPSVFAVLRLTANSNFVGCSTGKSAGSYCKILCATRRRTNLVRVLAAAPMRNPHAGSHVD
jgi:hypothetical protein